MSSATTPGRASAQGAASGLVRARRLFVRGLRDHFTLVAGVLGLAVLVAVALAAPLIAPGGPTAIDPEHTLTPPFSGSSLLGTDELGRDELARLLYAARIDLFVATASIVTPFVVGTAVGAVAAYRGGWFDVLVTRLIDVTIAFPILVLTIALVFVIGPGLLGIMVAIALVNWVAYARLVRAGVLRERGLDYVLAARTSGLSGPRVLVRHILPNVIGQSVVYATSDVVLVLITIVTLGYLGIGLQPPSPDWGSMISAAQPYINSDWWLAGLPVIAILITGLVFALLGDGLARIVDEE